MKTSIYIPSCKYGEQSLSKGSVLWITYFLRPCVALEATKSLCSNYVLIWLEVSSPIWNGNTMLSPVSSVSHWSSLRWCSLGPWADYLCLPSWSWFPLSHWVTSLPSSGWESVFMLNAVTASDGSTLFLHVHKFSAAVQKVLSFSPVSFDLFSQGSVDSTWAQDSRN